jgi:hypothetical protein
MHQLDVPKKSDTDGTSDLHRLVGDIERKELDTQNEQEYSQEPKEVSCLDNDEG